MDINKLQILIIIGISITVIIQFLIDFIFTKKKKKLKLIFGVIFLIISLIGVFFNFNLQLKQNTNAKDEKDSLNVQIKTNIKLLKFMENEIHILQNKNDSLLIVNNNLQVKIENQSSELKKLNIMTDVGFRQNQEYFESIKTKDISRNRIITSQQKEILLSVLIKYKGKIKITVYANESECHDFGYKWMDIFKDAGWEIIDNDITSNSMIINGITLLIKDKIECPKELNYVTEALDKANFVYDIKLYGALPISKLVLYIGENK